MDLSDSLKQIERRYWSVIKNDWMRHIPSIHPIGSRPNEGIGEFLEARSASLIFESDVMTNYIEGLRQLVLWEGIYLMHKASHVVGVAETSADSGTQTWSLSNGYQGALFCAKAIQHFLGVASGSFDSHNFIIDSFNRGNTGLKFGKRHERFDATIQTIRVNRPLQNKNFWEVFQRTIAVSEIDVWPREAINRLKSLQLADFSHQRNRLHYTNVNWVCLDLFEPVITEDFGSHGADWKGDLDPDEKDFSLVLGITLLKLGYLLFKDLAQVSNKLADEFELFKKNISDVTRHPLMTI